MSNHEEVKKIYQQMEYDPDNIELNILLEMMNINLSQVEILKEIIKYTDAKVVVTSSIKQKKFYPYIEAKLIELGIPIIGTTEDRIIDKGTGIKKYLMEHEITEYAILDDDIFDDYDEILLSKLVKTSFYNGGLQEKHKEELIKKLTKKH